MSALRSEPERVACAGCGSLIPVRTAAVHPCDWFQWLDHQVDLCRDELDRFEHELDTYLRSPRGRFEMWDAERRRRGAR